MEHLPRLADRGLEVGETENEAGVTAAKEFSSGPGPEREDGRKSNTSYAEASVGDDIIDLVRDIENLTKDDAITRLLELEERHEKTFFEIGGVLSAIQKRKWFDPFASLDEWVENNTALSRSKARALTQIYYSVVTSGVKWAKVKHLEWTKLNAIAGLLDASNADHWIEVASNHSRAKIKQLVQEHLAGLAGRKPKGSTATRVKTFKFRDDQIKTVQAAIDRATKMAVGVHGQADGQVGRAPAGGQQQHIAEGVVGEVLLRRPPDRRSVSGAGFHLFLERIPVRTDADDQRRRTCYGDASDAWEARKYSPNVGSPELFRLTKKPFLELFGRSDVATDDMRTYAEWMVAILIANRLSGHGRYPLEPTEARAALRKAGADVPSAVAHRLAHEMAATSPDERAKRWRTIVGPVFKDIWPLDVELQSNASNFTFVQLLAATGDAFPEAAEAIIPFIRPDDPRRHTAIFSIAQAPDLFYKVCPTKVLDLIAAIVGDSPPRNFINIDQALSKIRSAEPDLANSRKFQKLTT